MSSSPVDPRDGAAGPPAVQPRWADAATAAGLARALHAWPSHVLTATQAAALLRLLDGVYTPLTGFMTAAEAARAAGAEALDDGSWWPVPVILDVLPATAERLATGGPLVLREPEGRAVAVHARRRRPGRTRPAGASAAAVVGLQAPPVYDLIDLRLSPTEVRDEIARRGWRTAIAVPVERVLHRADIAALDALAAAHDAGLVILAVTRAGVRRRPRSLRAPAGAAGGGGASRARARPARPRHASGGRGRARVARSTRCWRGPSAARGVVAWDARRRRAGRGGPPRRSRGRRRRVGAAGAGGRAATRRVDAWTFPEVAAELDRRRRRRGRAASPSSSPACPAPASRRSPTRCASACSRTAGAR